MICRFYFPPAEQIPPTIAMWRILLFTGIIFSPMTGQIFSMKVKNIRCRRSLSNVWIYRIFIWSEHWITATILCWGLLSKVLKKAPRYPTVSSCMWRSVSAVWVLWSCCLFPGVSQERFWIWRRLPGRCPVLILRKNIRWNRRMRSVFWETASIPCRKRWKRLSVSWKGQIPSLRGNWNRRFRLTKCVRSFYPMYPMNWRRRSLSYRAMRKVCRKILMMMRRAETFTVKLLWTRLQKWTFSWRSFWTWTRLNSAQRHWASNILTLCQRLEIFCPMRRFYSVRKKLCWNLTTAGRFMSGEMFIWSKKHLAIICPMRWTIWTAIGSLRWKSLRRWERHESPCSIREPGYLKKILTRSGWNFIKWIKPGHGNTAEAA